MEYGGPEFIGNKHLNYANNFIPLAIFESKKKKMIKQQAWMFNG